MKTIVKCFRAQQSSIKIKQIETNPTEGGNVSVSFKIQVQVWHVICVFPGTKSRDTPYGYKCYLFPSLQDNLNFLHLSDSGCKF